MANEEKKMTATQALDGLKPLLAPEEGEEWLKDIREGLDQRLGDDEPESR